MLLRRRVPEPLRIGNDGEAARIMSTAKTLLSQDMITTAAVTGTIRLYEHD